MCTALSWTNGHHYFGRNLDYERSFGEQVAIMPRRFPLHFRNGEVLACHHAMIGMAHMAQDYPLYYEATNECGLSMAALNFPESAAYHPQADGCSNVAPFELIPWLLSRCATLQEARQALAQLNIWQQDFSPVFPASPLHWLVSDRSGNLVVESTADGLHIYENDVHVLTNEPPFPFQRTNLRQYLSLSRSIPADTCLPGKALTAFSRGMGAMGLPGDLSSASRFVRAAFTVGNSRGPQQDSVSQFFHLLTSVEQVSGCVHLGGDEYEMTLYSCCCDTDIGTYYYTTYHNRALTAVELHHEDLDGSRVVSYPLLRQERITTQN